MADLDRFILRKLAFTGPDVETKELAFSDGLNLIWGASNAGKSFIVKALDFMMGAGATLPNITERRGYDRCWLELVLPKTGKVTLARGLVGGGVALHFGAVEPGAVTKPDRVLAGIHAAKTQRSESLSGFLLNELDIVDRKIARVLDGTPAPFTFRFFAPYVFTEETAMLGEASPLLTYRDPHNSKYGELSVDEEVIKESGVRNWFYRYLLDHATDAQFVVVENDPAPFDLGLTARVAVFTGPRGQGGRQGLF
jgi:hypothetical protein